MSYLTSPCSDTTAPKLDDCFRILLSSWRGCVMNIAVAIQSELWRAAFILDGEYKERPRR
jgi:hypothetical protein